MLKTPRPASVSTAVLLLVMVTTQVQSLDLTNDFCLDAPDKGNCSRVGWTGFERYFYNGTSQQCEKFIYSGCGGNNNQFFEQVVCERICGFDTSRVDYEGNGDLNAAMLGQISLADMSKRLCHRGLPFKIPGTVTDSVQCNASLPCPSDYDCILGPKNYYPLAICCPKWLITTPQPPNIETTPPVDDGQHFPMQPEWCLLSPVPGPCRQVTTNWYYDVDAGRCLTFTYGGCKGNQNRFRTKALCERICPPLIVQLGYNPSTVRVPLPSPGSIETLPHRCNLPPDSGLGTKFSVKYYFEPVLGSCLPFLYGSCGGNENQFENELSCVVTCRPEIAETATEEARLRNVPLIFTCAAALPCGLPNFIPTTTPVPLPGMVISINFFRHPSNGYRPCERPTFCLLDPCTTAVCPAYPEAICKPNACDGCLAEFFLNDQRVNCSSISSDIINKPGNCPLLPSNLPCPGSAIGPDGKLRPENKLCAIDAECFADQRCCVDPCYGPSYAFKTCQTPYRRVY